MKLEDTSSSPAGNGVTLNRKDWPFATILTTHASWCVLVLTVLGAALRSYRLNARSLNLDEGFSYFLSRVNSIEFWSFIRHGELNMLLYYGLLRVWRPSAQSEAELRLLSVVFGALTVPAVYLLGRRLYGRGPALVATLLITLQPYAIELSQGARSYALAILLVTVAAWFLVGLVEEPSRKLVAGYALSAAAAVYSHLLALLAIVAQAVSLPLGLRQGPVKFILVAFGLLTLLLLPCLILLMSVPAPARSLEWVPPLSFSQLKALLYALTLSKARSLAYLLAWSLAIVAASRENSEERWRDRFIVLSLLLPAALTIAISVFRPALVERYLAICIPASVLLAARGLTALSSLARWAAVALLGLIVFYSTSAIHFYFRHPEYFENWRAAILYVLDNVSPADAVVVDPYTRLTFDYYAQRTAAASPAYRPADDLASAAAATPAATEIWVLGRKDVNGTVNNFLAHQSKYCEASAPFEAQDIRAFRLRRCGSNENHAMSFPRL